MFKRILVPLDGSDLAETVLSHVSEMAACYGAEIVLLRVVTEPAFDYALTTPAIGNRIHAGMEEDATAYLDRVAGNLKQSGLKVNTLLSEGPVAAGILDAALRIQADLIAMSTHGRGGIARLVMGSVAEQVLQHATVPVLLFRPR